MSAVPIRVRPFAQEDREALRALFVASRDLAFPWVEPGKHQLEDFDVSTQGERILVALDGETIVGFASIWEPDSFVHSLYVHPDHLRRGIGRLLLQACEPYFLSRATLKCLKANQRALRFYRSLGWRERGEGADAGGPYFVMECPLRDGGPR